MKGLIYGLECTCHPEKGFRYVGQTWQRLNVRLTNHRCQARFGTDQPVYRWIRKHGPENIRASVIGGADSADELNSLERGTIAAYGLDRLLNVSVGGVDGTTLNRKRPEFSERIRGEGHPTHVLTEDDVRQIRKRYSGKRGEVSALSREYGVSLTTISDVLLGNIWSHLPLGPIQPNRRTRLGIEDVKKIRRERDTGRSVQEIADDFGVTITNIYHILSGKTWKHVE